MSHLDLDEQLNAARADLAAALTAGSDTTGPRYRLKELEDHAAALQRQARETQAAAAGAEAAKTEQAAAEYADQTHAAVVVAAEVPGLSELAGGPLPDLPRDPMIDHLSRMLAAAESGLRSAEEELAPLRERVSVLTGRCNEKRAELAAIKLRRVAGDERESDADAVALLASDLQSLEQMLGVAQGDADASRGRCDAARSAFGRAQVELEKLRAKAAHAAAVERLKLVEQILLGAFDQMVALGRQAGMGSPWAAFQPRPETKRAITGAFPPGYRGAL
ncbi:MAG TPA: hypothetical protein VLC92_09625 [Rhodocyclaceae bacterium]|nr:hypothetical protein [Rhodocyclaceae bacterium]